VAALKLPVSGQEINLEVFQVNGMTSSQVDFLVGLLIGDLELPQVKPPVEDVRHRILELGEEAQAKEARATFNLAAKKAYIEHEIKVYLCGNDTELKAKRSGKACLAKSEAEKELSKTGNVKKNSLELIQISSVAE